jgi:hypothetical protein
MYLVILFKKLDFIVETMLVGFALFYKQKYINRKNYKQENLKRTNFKPGNYKPIIYKSSKPIICIS